MKDIPLFTTDFGVASLILKEIPYKFVAYIRVLNAQPGMIQNLMEECAAFCRAAGADCAFAADSAELEIYPLHHTVRVMRGNDDWEPEAHLFPVTEQTVKRWREIYNEKMASVPTAAASAYARIFRSTTSVSMSSCTRCWVQ